jgi:hypothetical protein
LALSRNRAQNLPARRNSRAPTKLDMLSELDGEHSLRSYDRDGWWIDERFVARSPSFLVPGALR